MRVCQLPRLLLFFALRCGFLEPIKPPLRELAALADAVAAAAAVCETCKACVFFAKSVRVQVRLCGADTNATARVGGARGRRGRGRRRV